MTTPVIIDAIAVAVLAGFAILGAWKGLLRTLAGLLVLVLSLAGAGIIASALSAPAAKLIAPVVEKRIESRLDEAMREQRPGRETEEDLPLAELLEGLGGAFGLILGMTGSAAMLLLIAILSSLLVVTA